MQLSYFSEPQHVNTSLSNDDENIFVHRSFAEDNRHRFILHHGGLHHILQGSYATMPELYVVHEKDYGNNISIHLDSSLNSNLPEPERIMSGVDLFSHIDAILHEPSIQGWALRAIEVTPECLYFCYCNSNQHVIVATLKLGHASQITIFPEQGGATNNQEYCRISTYTNYLDIDFYKKNPLGGNFLITGQIVIESDEDGYTTIREYYNGNLDNEQLVRAITPAYSRTNDPNDMPDVNVHIYNNYFGPQDESN